MRFQIPQFIESEDKIIGPLTMRQFLYLAIAGGISFVLFFILPLSLWILIAFMFFSVAVAFAFIKINGQSLIKLFGSIFGHFTGPRLFIWSRHIEEKTIDVPGSVTQKKTADHRPKTSGTLRALGERIHTSSKSVPKRENPALNNFTTKAFAKNTAAKEAPADDSSVTLELPSGKREKAKRVDYTE